MNYTTDVFGGGGAKGLAQIPYLIKAEEDSGGVPYWKTRDLIVGTSVGAINAALMATGKLTAKELDVLFTDAVTKIFAKKKWYQFPKTPFYDKEVFVKIWNDAIGNDFKMGDCKTKLMITSVNVVEDEWGCDRNVFFKSWKPADADRKLVDVVVDSFSAPLYFGSTCRPDEQRVYVDGGCGENNLPIEEARIESELFGWYSNGNTLILNAVGCLYSTNPDKQSFAKMCKANTLMQLMDFINPLSGGMSRSMSQSDQIRKAEYISSHVASLAFRYWDCKIPRDADKMDAIKFLDFYRECGVEMAKKPLVTVN